MSTQQIFGVIGAGIGFAIGGPQGAAYGYSIGSSIGGVIDPPEVTTTAQSLENLKLTGLQYGKPIPYIAGSPRVAGHVIAIVNQTKVKHKKKVGGGGGFFGSLFGGGSQKYIYYTYHVDVLYMLADVDNAAGIEKVFRNGELIYDPNSLDTETVQASVDNENWGEIIFYSGAADQMPDPTLEAHFGAGSTPAYRGRTTVMIKGLNLFESGEMPNLEFILNPRAGYEFETIPTYDIYAKTGLFSSDANKIYLDEQTGYVWFYIVNAYNTSLQICCINSADGSVIADHNISSPDGYNYFYIHNSTTFQSNNIFADDDYVFVIVSEKNASESPRQTLRRFNRNTGEFYDPSYYLFDKSSFYDPVSGEFISKTTISFLMKYGNEVFIQYGNYGVARYQISAGSNALSISDKESDFYTTYRDDPSFPNLRSSCYGFHNGGILGGDSILIRTADADGRFFLISAYNMSLKLRFDWLIGTENVDIQVDTKRNRFIVHHYEKPELLIVDYDNLGSPSYQVVTWTIPEDYAGSLSIDLDGTYSSTYKTSSIAYDKYSDLYSVKLTIVNSKQEFVYIDPDTLTASKIVTYNLSGQGVDDLLQSGWQGNHYTSAGFEFVGYDAPENVTLGVFRSMFQVGSTKLPDVVKELCILSNLTDAQIDVSDLPLRDVTLANPNIAPSRSLLESLSQAYYFDCIQSGSMLKFITRGKPAIKTISYDELGAGIGNSQDGSELLSWKRASSVEIPANYAVKYQNILDDHSVGAEYAVRVEAAQQGTVSEILLPMALTPNEAAGIAKTALSVASAEVLSSSISLLGEHVDVEPSDILGVTNSSGKVFRARVISKTTEYPLVKFDLRLDNEGGYYETAETSTDYTPQTTIKKQADTKAYYLDIPALRQADADIAGFYVAAGGVFGTGSKWDGCSIYTSFDDVNYEQETDIAIEAVHGFCMDVLGDWTLGMRLDVTNSVTVNVGNGTLTSSTYDLVLNYDYINRCLVGGELCQYIDAELLSSAPNVYKITGFLRGRKGTEWASVGHVADERFVMLTDDDVSFIAMQSTDIGIEKKYKAAGYNQDLADVTLELFTNTAVNMKPRSPANVNAVIQPNNDVLITWQRRTRYDYRLLGTLGHSCPLGEDSESYVVEIYASGTFGTLKRAVTSSTESFNYTEAMQIADFGSAQSNVFIKIYQVSAVVGRGYPATYES